MAPAEVLGDGAGGHAFECGEVEPAGEVAAEFGITLPSIGGGSGDMKGAVSPPRCACGRRSSVGGVGPEGQVRTAQRDEEAPARAAGRRRDRTHAGGTERTGR